MMFQPQQQQKLTEYPNQFECSPSSSSSYLHTSPTLDQHHLLTNLLLPFSGRHGSKLTRSGCFRISPRLRYRLKLWFCSVSPMADDSSVYIPTEFRKKKQINGKQKREDLEREVFMLQKMLEHEHKVRDYLERLQTRQDGSALSIPNFLPPKMKEMLAELAMVENEITRLESLITRLQAEVEHEKQMYKALGRHSLRTSHQSSQLLPKPNEKGTFDTKALHFISKAIKGDYHLSDFTHANDLKSAVFSSQKENRFREDGEEYREKVSKRNGALKPPSPLRDQPRHLTPRRDRNLDVPIVLPPSTPLHSEEEANQRWQPNKLSENIMKCLIFIFVRLLRTSRVMELEKSGTVARSTNFSTSFRAETGPNSKTGLVFHKDSRQQDPYGIFDSEESIVRDIGQYKNLVRFTSSSMDMKFIQSSSSVPLLQKLKVLMDGLKKVDLRFLNHQQKLAFWINMYNACIMHGYLQYGIPSVFSPENLQALIKKATLNIAGNTISARAMEHFILRKPRDSVVREIIGKDDKGMMIHELYGVDTPDPNITFALCCGTRSSPAVKIYKADGVINELEKSKLEYLQAAIMVKRSAKRIAIPELLVRNMNELAGDKEALVEWLCQQLPTAGSLRKSIVDCFRGVQGGGGGKVEKIAYEYEFQYLLAI